MRESLLQIGARLKSSKWGGKSFLPFYDELFAPFRDEPITIVEFGIDHGCSLQMWYEYFTKARIIGIDEGPIFKIEIANSIGPRVSGHMHRQDDPEVGRIMGTFKPTIIVDDAGHNDGEQRRCFTLSWPHLCRGGVYCIEDIQTDDYKMRWKADGATIYAGYTSSELHDFRYDDVLAVFRK